MSTDPAQPLLEHAAFTHVPLHFRPQSPQFSGSVHRLLHVSPQSPSIGASHNAGRVAVTVSVTIGGFTIIQEEAVAVIISSSQSLGPKLKPTDVVITKMVRVVGVGVTPLQRSRLVVFDASEVTSTA